MIFRRIKAHIEKENWFAVFIDFAIVVIGVFIGLQVANWNETRLTTAQEIDYLRSIRSDLTQSIDFTEFFVEDAENSIASVMALMRGAEEQPPTMSLPDFDKHMLDGVFRYRAFTSNLTTLQEMKSSGELSTIGSMELRQALTRVLTQIESLQANEQDYFNIIQTFSDPWLVHNFDLRRIHALDPAIIRRTDLQGIQPLGTDDPRTILQDRELQNVLVLRSITHVNVARSAENLLATYKGAAELVDQRLETLGAIP